MIIECPLFSKSFRTKYSIKNHKLDEMDINEMEKHYEKCNKERKGEKE